MWLRSGYFNMIENEYDVIGITPNKLDVGECEAWLVMKNKLGL